MAAPWKTRAERGLDTWSLNGGPLLVGPDMSALAAQIIEWAKVDVGLKEPLRKRLKEWQRGVLARMKADAPDDPGSSAGSRIEKALKARAPVISRTRNAIYASFVTDTAYLNRHIYDTYKGKRGKQTRPHWAGVAWALSQHEDLTLRHSRGSAKFMERPFKAGGSAVDKLVEAAFEEAKQSIERA
jgi:hypothetical protein